MSRPICIIAEMACSHEGDPKLARTIIDGAGAACADAIQFQIWRAADIMVPHHPDFPVLRRIELSREDWAGLFAHVRERYPAMQVIACVYEEKSADFAEEMGADAFKIHSADLSNPGLLAHVAKKNRRVDLSTGASTVDEIALAIRAIRRASDCPVWLMHGYQVFPTPPGGVHMDFMMKLKSLFEMPVGYQDHSDAESPAAFHLCAAAAGMGVDAVEKHITHDRSQKGIDHQAALNPDEFSRFTAMIRQIEAARGLAVPRAFSEDEETYRKYSKKSIVAARDLPAGHVLAEGDLAFMRAEALGLPPDQAGRLLGKTLARPVAALRLVGEADLER
ncbi:MAG: N-acetylneuraminate synthase family protein [Pseudomonadota bacterium]